MVENNLSLALHLAGHGYKVFPCKADKSPHTEHGYKQATSDPAEVSRFWTEHPDALVGIACKPSGIFALDVDRKNGKDGDRELADLIVTRGEGKTISTGPIQATPNGGFHLLFAYPKDIHVPNKADALGIGLDLRSEGYICTGPGYRWLDGHGFDTLITEAPVWLLDMIRALSASKQPERPPSGWRQVDPGRAATYWYGRYVGQARNGNRNDTLFYMGLQLNWSNVDQAEAEGLAAQFALETGLPEREAITTMRSAYRYPKREPSRLPFLSSNGHGTGNAVGVNTAISMPSNNQVSKPGEPVAAEDKTPLPGNLVRECLEWAEAGDAKLFAALYAGTVVYDHSSGDWYTWQGHYWQVDKIGAVYSMITNNVAAEYLYAAGDAQATGHNELAKELVKRAANLRTKKRIENVLALAARLPGIALTGEEWDRDPWLLACENGIVELQTGELRPGKPTDYVRVHIPVEWQGIDTAAPRWEQFQLEISENDPEVVAFKARMYGCAISGRVRERVFPILWGEGGQNGKGTELEAIGKVMGDLADTASADVLMDDPRAGDRPSPFLYGLRGKRFVWVKESKEGQRLNTGLVKMLSGGDTISARGNYMKYNVKFPATHTIFLMTNHKPHIPEDDAAMWKRVCLIPYNLSFVDHPTEPNERRADRSLDEKLWAERSGILAWIVRGCLEWQRIGLAIPEKLKAATEEYREEEDTLSQFEADRCVTHPNATVRGQEFYTEYVCWCEENSIKPMTGTAFGRKMGKRHSKDPHARGAVYVGIGLLKDEKW